MLVYGYQSNANPTLLEVISAEIDVFKKTMIFKTATGDIWKVPFESQTCARMMLNDLKTGLLVLDEQDDSNLTLRKENEYALQ